MSDGTKIEWTDATWNPVTGCSVVSPGCTNCYAMRLAGTRLQHHPSRKGLTTDSKAGPVWNGQVRFNEDWLTQPLAWTRPRTIFVCAHGDLFHENVPDEWIDRVFAVMALAPQHRFQVLTKRSARMREYVSAAVDTFHASPDSMDERFGEICVDLTASPCAAGAFEEVDWPLPNVWLGVSAEDQTRWDERKEDLRNTPAAVRFASFEPLLGPIDIDAPWLNWAITGGESGPKARPMHPDWARSIRDQCQAAGVPFFFKQWGSYEPEFPQYGHEYGLDDDEPLCADQDFPAEGVLYRNGYFYDGVEHQPHLNAGAYWIRRVGKKRAGRLLDGIKWNGMPQ